MFRPLASLLIALTVLVPLRAQPAFTRIEPTGKEIDASLRTDWYGIYHDGKKIGYYRTTRELTREGVRESAHMHMKLAAFEQKTDMVVSQSCVFESKAPYALRKVEFSEQMGPVVTRITMTQDKKCDVVMALGENVRKKTIEPIDLTLGDMMAAELWIKRGPKIGSQIVTRDIEVKELRIDPIKNKVLEMKTSVVGGVDVKFYDVESISNQGQITSIVNIDDQGRLLMGKIGGIFEMRMETEAEAKNTEYSKDLFVLGLAKVDRKLGNQDKIDELVMEVDGPAAAFIDGPRQSLVKKAGKNILQVGKKYGAPMKATKEEIADSLKETHAYDISHPKVKALAARAVGDAKTDEEKVKNISAFVSRYIHGKMTGAMPSIHDLIERKEGDCKSYALLFCTLARASGVPAREVSGLLYVGDSAKAFGGHAWNEVVLDGVWVPVDASRNETEVNATHLSFGAEKTAARGMLETMGKVKFRVVEVKSK